MEQFCAWRRFPRAGVDPISTPQAALAVISMAMQRPLRHETLVLALDAERRGVTVVVVDGTANPDAVVVVGECIAMAVAGATPVEALVLATVRPAGMSRGLSGGEATDIGEDELGAGDLDRWFEASDVVEACGLELVEWFVINGGENIERIRCPRDDIGERPRW
ncbi:MAG: hypothetical protein M3337_03410 [Actinomycetota bacterium]|nr:hypothetical protein [Actinomycetota bacterium]